MTTLQGALWTGYELDLMAQGGGIFRFSNGTNELGTDMVWQGSVYYRIPIEAQGFDISGTGKLPRPTLRVANVNQYIGGLSRLYGGLVGCKLTRRRTFAKYLDAVNFTGGNPTADSTAEFAPDVFYVERLVTENKFKMEWELVAALDLSGIMIPKRQIIANTCTIAYKGPECGYIGGISTCDKGLNTANGCSVHFGATAELPYGGFPAAGLRRS